MSKVLILGATGYIGQALALSLLRSGLFTVYGLARSASKARSLSALEIIPVLGSASDSAGYVSLIASAHIDIVVDAAGANRESAQILADVKRAGAERLAAAAAQGVRSPKLGFIYTSGMWVHGSSMEAVNDLDPVGVAAARTQPPPLVAWRPRMEQDVLGAADVLDTMVVRPALLYGGAGAIWSSLLGPLQASVQSRAAVARVPAEADSMPALIHVEDVARGLRAAVEKLPLLAGTGVYPVFDLVTSQESMRLLLEEAAKVLGFDGKVELVGAQGDAFAEAMSVSLNGSGARARMLLGWEPRRVGMLKGVDVFVKAWLAAQE
ncbi:hypothetical protein MMC17_007210 [Xylographa soralifera]|nr:hypothetical protein [Xylographa soralifera]